MGSRKVNPDPAAAERLGFARRRSHRDQMDHKAAELFNKAAI